jgi:hypothetical protein
MRSQFTIGALGAATIAAAVACSSSSGTANPGNSSSGATSSGDGSSGSASAGDGTSDDASSGSTSSGSTSSGSSSGASSGSSSGADGGTPPGTDGGLAPAPYPSGPYCAAAGSAGTMATGCVIPNLSWNGYVDDTADAIATSKPYVAYSLLDVYNAARASGRKYAMVNIAEFDCPGCQSSATAMGMTTDGGASVDQAGGVIIEVLMTAGFVAPPTKTDLDSWISKYNLFFTTVADLGSALTTSNTLGRRDQAYIIDLTTMKVIKAIDGSIAAAGTGNSGPQGIAYMHMLLGK